MQVEPCPFYDPEDLVAQVIKQIENAQKKGESIDYLTFVPDGEPTLDINLGHGIDLLKPTGIRRLAEFIASLNRKSERIPRRFCRSAVLRMLRG